MWFIGKDYGVALDCVVAWTCPEGLWLDVVLQNDEHMMIAAEDKEAFLRLLQQVNAKALTDKPFAATKRYVGS